jgi:L-fuconate dehydratase
MSTIEGLTVRDARFPLAPGEGVDAVHSDPIYSYAVTLLEDGRGRTGSGLAFTLGGGNDLVCRAIQALAEPLVDQEIEAVMADFGAIQRRMAEHPQYRWLGPHKGVVHLALSSITNACFDLWAKTRGVPLWKLLLDLSPEQVVACLDLSYLEDVLTPDDALRLLREHLPSRPARAGVLQEGYPGYDTSIGWFNYPDAEIRDTAMKLKVGSADPERDVRRACLVRETVGPDVRIMLDANQAWSLPAAVRTCLALSRMDPFWVEEPTHPDDVLAHQTLARAIAPIPVALGEHVPHRVLFKNFMQAGAARFIQVDAVRVAGVSEFITVSLLARKFGLQVVPHVGDMGQLHQHLVLFNHVALGLERLFLEYIPHLRAHFVHPARVEGGIYHTPQEPGASSDLRE